MNTKKVVFNKLFSKESAKAQKLSKQRRVSFSIVEEMESLTSKLEDAQYEIEVSTIDSKTVINRIKEDADELKSYISDLDSNYEILENLISEAESALRLVESKIDELGIRPMDIESYAYLYDLKEGMSSVLSDAKMTKDECQNLGL